MATSLLSLRLGHTTNGLCGKLQPSALTPRHISSHRSIPSLCRARPFSHGTAWSLLTAMEGEGRNQTLRFSVPLPKTPAQPQRELFTPLSRAWTDYLLVINLLRFHRHTFAGRFPTHISGRRGSQRHILTHAKALWWIRGSSIHPSTLSKTVPNIPFHTWSIMNVPFLMHVQYCTFTHWQRSSLNY